MGEFGTTALGAQSGRSIWLLEIGRSCLQMLGFLDDLMHNI
jgi:hypothetical protein